SAEAPTWSDAVSDTLFPLPPRTGGGRLVLHVECAGCGTGVDTTLTAVGAGVGAAGAIDGAGDLLHEAVHVSRERSGGSAEDPVLLLQRDEHLAQSRGESGDPAPGGFRERRGDAA